MKWTRLGLVAALGTAVLLVVVACGGAAEPTAAPTAPPATPTPTRPVAPTATAPTAGSPAAPTATPRPTATPAPLPTPTQRAPAGTLNVAVAGLGPEIFVARRVTGAETALFHMVSDTLIGRNAASSEPEPRWANQWSFQKIGNDNVWSFKLQPGVVINEGQGAITSEDVKFNFAEALKPDASSAARKALLIDKDLNQLEIVGPLEFRLHSASFDTSLFDSLVQSFGGIPWQPKAYSEKAGDEGYSAHPIGTGSFVFKSGAKGSKYSVEAVPNHWRKTASVQTVNLLVVPEAATRLAMLKTGQADLTPLESKFKKELTGNLRVHPIPAQSVAHITLGGMYYDLPDKLGKDPWVGYNDKARKVRQAMSIAIDRQAVLNRLLFGEGVLTPSGLTWLPGPYPWMDPAWKIPAYDPARAKQLLAEAGYAGGFRVEMPVFSLGGLPELPDITEAVAGYWEALGLTVKRSPQDFSPTFVSRLRTRDTAGFAWVLYGGVSTEPFAAANQFVKEGTFGYLHDPKAQEYVAKSSVEPDIAKRHALSRAFGSYAIEEVLRIPLFTVNGIWGAGPRLRAWENIPGFFYLNNAETITVNP